MSASCFSASTDGIIIKVSFGGFTSASYFFVECRVTYIVYITFALYVSLAGLCPLSSSPALTHNLFLRLRRLELSGHSRGDLRSIVVFQGLLKLQFDLLVLRDKLFLPGREEKGGELLLVGRHLTITTLLCLLVEPLCLAFLNPFR